MGAGRPLGVGILGAAAAAGLAVSLGHAPVASLLLGVVATLGFGVAAGVAGLAWRDRASLVAGGVALAIGGATLLGAPSRPGVILVVVDCLGANRFTADLMPATWALGEGAWRFEYALAQSSWTRSAVPSILTGRWPKDHGMYHLKPAPDRLREGVPTLGTWFHAAGWATAAFAEQAQVDPAFGLAVDFDRYGFRDGDAPHLLARLDRWHRYFRLSPRFVWLHLLDIHKPYEPDPTWVAAGIPPTTLPLDDWGSLMRQINQGELVPTAADWAHLEALHEAEIRQLDARLGSLWARFAADGTLDSSWILVTADHGEAFGEHGWFTHGGAPYAELVQVPLVIRPPGGLRGGRVVPGHARQIDLAPTMLSLAGLPIPADLPGQDLRPVLEGLLPAPTVSFAEYDGEGERMLGVRDGAWSYLRLPGGERLFDLAIDPGETVDRSPGEPERLLRMRALADGYGGSGGGVAVEVDPATTDELRALGYLE